MMSKNLNIRMLKKVLENEKSEFITLVINFLWLYI